MNHLSSTCCVDLITNSRVTNENWFHVTFVIVKFALKTLQETFPLNVSSCAILFNHRQQSPHLFVFVTFKVVLVSKILFKLMDRGLETSLNLHPRKSFCDLFIIIVGRVEFELRWTERSFIWISATLNQANESLLCNSLNHWERKASWSEVGKGKKRN